MDEGAETQSKSKKLEQKFMIRSIKPEQEVGAKIWSKKLEQEAGASNWNKHLEQETGTRS